MFLAVFLAGVFSVPLIWIVAELNISATYFSVFLIGFAALIAVYITANVHAAHIKGSRVRHFFKVLFLFPIFLALSMGLSLHNAIAVLQGYLGKQTAFVRTPKFNIQNLGDSWKAKKYVKTKFSWTLFFEGILAVYFLSALILAWQSELYTFWVFHLLLFVGYSMTFFFTLSHLRAK